MSETTTTTTTKAPETTTTTTVATTTNTTTETAAAVTQPVVERRGEVSVDQNASASVLKEQSSVERLDAARAEALRNHAHEHANDDGDVNSRDRVDQ